MNWKKLGMIGIGIIVILIGVFIYETVTDYFYRTRTDKLISTMESDYNRVIDELSANIERVSELEDTVSTANILNSELGDELAESKEIAEFFRNENRRLGEILEGSLTQTTGIGETNQEIGATIDRLESLLIGVTGGSGTEQE